MLPLIRSLARDIALFLVVPALLAAPANAQLAVDAPSWVTVTEATAPLRCGDLDRFYTIAELPRGAVLRVNGVTSEWYRVDYPRGIHPVAKPDEVRVIEEGRGELAKPSKLRHPSLLYGASGSWWSVYGEDLPPGTPVRIVKTERNADGDVAAYIVEPPAPPAVPYTPSGYIRRGLVREATKAEIDEHTRATMGAAQPPASPPTEPPAAEPAQPADPTTSQPSGQPSEQPARPTTEQPAAVPPAGQPAAAPGEAAPAQEPKPSAPAAPAEARTPPPAAEPRVDGALLMPMTTQTPAPLDAAPPTAGSPGAPAQAAEPVAPPPPPEPPFTSLNRLEELRTRVASMPDSDLEELIAAYERIKPAFDEARVRTGIDNRLTALRNIRFARETRGRLDAAIDQSSTREIELQRVVDHWQRSQAYTMVGRLVPSRLYDGEELPRMYRVESVRGAAGPRTLGYVQPDEKLITPAMLGEVVGVIGESEYNASLRLLVIKPVSVDVLAPDRSR